MNILLITPEYPPKHIGGGGIVYKTLAMELKSKGHKVSVFSGNCKNRGVAGEIELIYDNGVPVYFLPLLPAPKTKNFTAETYTLPTLRAFIFLIKELFQSDHDIIHLHGFCHPLIDIAALACILKGKKYIVTCHGIPKTPEKGSFPLKILFKIYLLTIEKVLVKNATLATVVSRSLLNECRERGLTNTRMMVIYNGPNPDLERIIPISSEEIDERYSLKDKRVIFAVGRLTPVKGFQYLIEAMEIVSHTFPDVVAIIAGAGPYQATLKKLVYERGLSDRVKLVGKISEQEKAALYRRCDTIVFPSLQEPFGLVLLEAFVMHKPIIAFKSGSVTEIVDDKEDGLLVPAGNTQQLAKAITLVLLDKELRLKLTKNTYMKILAFTWRKIIEKYIEVYRETAHDLIKHSFDHLQWWDNALQEIE
ncbi:MAG: glycosyltransferase family 4 protein [Nitrososphaeria archaeon]